ncbi:MAG: hypothetical protein EPO51_18065 [Phenylobacterium sp.]|uniref:Hsp70 family protein n=1 Tax=Phenylobacterium sp. TaxID=1871053 RepID=UPI0011FE7915|nr:Hsp70 family protein [Phenylobacterium sp.]TAJ70435.1 MAG: hypothetical protein EPO51_18065 [Phenylobacterium sp.]
MESDRAAELIESLCDRLEPSSDGLRYSLPGTVSRREHEALRTAIGLLLRAQSDVSVVDEPAVAPAPPVETNVALSEAWRESEPVEDLIACLDFGTAFSKAGLGDLKKADGFIELALGKLAGETEEIYPVSSSLFFENGRVLFGPQAVTRSLLTNRPRLDSIKRYISEMVQQVDYTVIPPEINITPYAFSLRDGVLLFLAYLTDLLGQALEAEGASRYTPRRYTLPGLEAKQAQRGAEVDGLMKALLAQAQVLADTFQGRWSEGVPVAEAWAALRTVEQLKELPSGIISDGLPEALAAAQSAIDKTTNRTLMLVVDVGAGTSDVGAFVVQPGRDGPVVAPVAGTMKVLRKAGDRIDEALIDLILTKAGAVPGSQTHTIYLNELRLKVRQIKRELLTVTPEGTLVLLSDDGSVDVTQAELEQNTKVTAFVRDLKKTMADSLAQLSEEALRSLNGRCRVVLTGGGSRLGALRDACGDALTVNGLGISLSVIDADPEWLSARPQDFVDVFDQMAVVAGGCLDPEDFARVARPMTSFGAGAPQRVIEPSYKA